MKSNALSVSRSVQYDNAEDVINAYNSRQVPAFAIFCGKQFIVKYEGDHLAEGANQLQMLLQGLMRSAAIYTLVVYENPPDTGIKNNTPYDGSVNFQLREKPISYLSDDMHGAVGGGLGALIKKMEEQQEFIDLLIAREAEKKEQPKEKHWLEKMLEDQGVKEALIGRGVALLDAIIPIGGSAAVGSAAAAPSATQAAPMRISGVPDNSEWYMSLNLEERKGIDQALTVLFRTRADMGLILHKLARMATANTEQFNNYIAIFKSMPG